MKKQVLVIGGGISGLSISKMLSETYNVKVLEKSEKVGGLVKCDRINGNLFHRVGGHVFNSKNSVVLDWFWQFFDKDKEFLQATRNAKILISEKIVGYPIENYLYQLPEDQTKLIIGELLAVLKNNSKVINDYENFKDFLIGNFGNALYQLYFGPYNTKIWNSDISNIPLKWLDGKLPMPNIEEVILNNIVKKEESNMVHSKFYYPIRNGSQFIVNRLSESLDITCSYQVKSIKMIDSKLVVDETLKADSIVYCGDIRVLGSIVHISDTDLIMAMKAVEELPSNGTSNVLCETDENDISWLYLPEDKFKAHRIIYTGNFSSSNNEGTARKTCVVEFSGKHNIDVMLRELKLLPGNLKALEFNYEPNSYVIQHPDTRDKIIKLKEILSKYRIYLLGRFAEWEYYNMDKAIESAMELRQKLKNILK